MPYICTRNQEMNGALVQLVRIRACHARGQGFESPTHRKSRQTATFVFLSGIDTSQGILTELSSFNIPQL